MTCLSPPHPLPDFTYSNRTTLTTTSVLLGAYRPTTSRLVSMLGPFRGLVRLGRLVDHGLPHANQAVHKRKATCRQANESDTVRCHNLSSARRRRVHPEEGAVAGEELAKSGPAQVEGRVELNGENVARNWLNVEVVSVNSCIARFDERDAGLSHHLPLY